MRADCKQHFLDDTKFKQHFWQIEFVAAANGPLAA
jgi:hypothetical protein